MKQSIQNRKGQKLAVIVEETHPQQGLAIVMHGLSGFKEQPHIQTIAETFAQQHYTVVRFDTTNTLGESDGKYEDATTTNYYEDLEDVIQWASPQEWYQEPFVLAGHSLGGMCVALFAEKFPRKVKAVAPISTVVSGKLSMAVKKMHNPEELKAWERTGWRVEASHAKPGVLKRLPWSHMTDRLRYDLLPQASALTMPVLLIVGENDTSTPPEHQRLLYNALAGKKELHVIRGGPHTFRSPEHLAELQHLVDRWVTSLS